MAVQDEIPGLGLRSERPRLNSAADLNQLKLSPTEGFVLSRVDGHSSYEDICKVSGLGREQTLEILRSLKHAKLILGSSESIVGRKRRPSTSRPVVESEARATAAAAPPHAESQPAGAKTSSSPASIASVPGEPENEWTRPKTGSGPKPGKGLGPLERLDDGSAVAAGELKDWPEADPLLKERIIRLHRRMRKLSAFELLGFSPKADAGAIRRAFTIASKELHPDRYFGQNLGSFKTKLAAIFARLTEAMQEIESGQKGKR